MFYIGNCMLYMISSRYLYSIRECWTCKSLNETMKCEVIFLKSNKSLSHWSMDGEDEIHPGLSPLAPWLRLVRCSLPSFNHSITLSPWTFPPPSPFFMPSLLLFYSPSTTFYSFPLSFFISFLLQPLFYSFPPSTTFLHLPFFLKKTWWCEHNIHPRKTDSVRCNQIDHLISRLLAGSRPIGL